MIQWLGAAALLVLSTSAHGAPYVPADDGTVLEVLATKRADPEAIELRRLRAAAAAAPDEESAAVRLARRFFDLALAEGDPRYIGYAQAALRRWPESPSASADVLVLHGKLRQYRHDFEPAMADFALALKADPANAAAHAWRAAIFMVQADYPGARRECALLAPLTTELHAVACAAYVDATTGHARAAYDRLAAALARDREGYPEFLLWIQTRLAEMAWRAGDTAAAEAHFRKGLALGKDDNFLLAAYADLLLELGRPADAAALLKDWARSDTLLLRLALAAHALGRDDAPNLSRALGDRFAEAGLRGEKLHLQEEARYLLELKGDAKAALAAAAENYRTQREPRDALILLEAAVAARDAAAAAPALRWLQETGFESRRLREAAAKVAGLPK